MTALDPLLYGADHVTIRWSKRRGSVSMACYRPLVQAHARRRSHETIDAMVARCAAVFFRRQHTGERPIPRPTRRCRVCRSTRSIRTHDGVPLCAEHDLTRARLDDLVDV